MKDRTAIEELLGFSFEGVVLIEGTKIVRLKDLLNPTDEWKTWFTSADIF